MISFIQLIFYISHSILYIYLIYIYIIIIPSVKLEHKLHSDRNSIKFSFSSIYGKFCK